jgi:hypothetical protein
MLKEVTGSLERTARGGTPYGAHGCANGCGPSAIATGIWCCLCHLPRRDKSKGLFNCSWCCLVRPIRETGTSQQGQAPALLLMPGLEVLGTQYTGQNPQELRCHHPHPHNQAIRMHHSALRARHPALSNRERNPRTQAQTRT